MSTVPTPADIYARSARALIAPAPHDPLRDGPFRALWERGVLGSRMIPTTKLVALTLAAGADWATGALAAPQVSVGQLAEATRITHGQVVVSLNILEQRGWLARSSRRDRWGVAEVRLTIPAAIMRRLVKPRPS
ncbi:MarR family transcriptional regulator [Streptomyces sp. R302]|uniref:MarR family transcriptional regulator n=1 Tax=unclassified Streptomyces TaxID=2593676 RepID=UPI00145D1D8E|nr:MULTISPECIES: helix-turn-helix domain-containing protein [unclassified Streptomyces]NML55691.1 MarR family transcriptional regulator [Streptomyces sp. R301]NML83967.1 MarR family transcriptional regulator [Streptomyces sp. R302]